MKPTQEVLCLSVRTKDSRDFDTGLASTEVDTLDLSLRPSFPRPDPRPTRDRDVDTVREDVTTPRRVGTEKREEPIIRLHRSTRPSDRPNPPTVWDSLRTGVSEVLLRGTKVVLHNEM